MWYLMNDFDQIIGEFETEDDAELALLTSHDEYASYIISAEEYEKEG